MIARADVWLLALAAASAVLVFRETPITEHHRGYDSDGVYYAAMAGASDLPQELARQAPFCHRVLTPAIAARMSGDVLLRFRRLALWSCVLNLCLLALLVRTSGATRSVAAFSMLLYAGVFWTVKFSAYSPAYVDFHTQTFLLFVALLAPIARARWWLLPVLVLGTLQKESLLAFVPFALFASWRARPQPTAAWLSFAALLLALPLLGWQAVRHAVPPANPYSPADPLAYLALLGAPGYGTRLLHAAISGLGLLPLVILLRPDVAWRSLRARPEWGLWLAISLALLFGGIDKERLFLYALPALMLLAASVLCALERALPRRIFLAFAALTVVVQAWLGHHLQAIPGFAEYLDRMVPIHASPRHRAYLREDLTGIAVWTVATAALLLPAWRAGARRQALAKPS